MLNECGSESKNHSHDIDIALPELKNQIGSRKCTYSLQWRHNGCDGVSNHQPRDYLVNRLFRRRSKKTPKLCVIGLCMGNSPVTGEFSAQMASNAENAPIWWRHHAVAYSRVMTVWMSSTLLLCFSLNLESMSYEVYQQQYRFTWNEICMGPQAMRWIKCQYTDIVYMRYSLLLLSIGIIYWLSC